MRTFYEISPNGQAGTITVIKNEFYVDIHNDVFKIERPIFGRVDVKPVFICVHEDDVLEAIRELAVSPHYTMDIREPHSEARKKDLTFSLTNNGQTLNLALDTGYGLPIQIYDIPFYHFRSVVLKMLRDDLKRNDNQHSRHNNQHENEEDILTIEER